MTIRMTEKGYANVRLLGTCTYIFTVNRLKNVTKIPHTHILFIIPNQFLTLI